MNNLYPIEQKEKDLKFYLSPTRQGRPQAQSQIYNKKNQIV